MTYSMLKTIKIEKHSTESRQGKKGTFYRLGICTKTKTGDEVWINGLCNYQPNWQNGHEIELDITKHEEHGLQFPFLNIPEGQRRIQAQPQNNELTEKIQRMSKKLDYLAGLIEGLSTGTPLELKNGDSSSVTTEVDPTAEQKRKEAEELAQSFGGKVEEITVEDVEKSMDKEIDVDKIPF